MATTTNKLKWMLTRAGALLALRRQVRVLVLGRLFSVAHKVDHRRFGKRGGSIRRLEKLGLRFERSLEPPGNTHDLSLFGMALVEDRRSAGKFAFDAGVDG